MRRLVLLVAFASACEEGDDRTSSSTIAPTSTATTSGDPTGGTTTEGGSEGESTSAPLPGACDQRPDCMLHSDCCTCEALHVDVEPAACDATCDRTKCEDWGVTEILCSHTCLLRLVECDASLVECADAAPECEDGFAASIEARCWTRHCVPVDLCIPI